MDHQPVFALVGQQARTALWQLPTEGFAEPI